MVISHTKPYNLTFEARPEYLYARVSGERDSYEISRQYWQEIKDECKRIGTSRVLIEENISDNVTAIDAFRMTTEFLQTNFSVIKIAFVDLCPEQGELNKFGELVAINRGVNIKLCKDTTDAETWLLKGEAAS